MRPLAPLALLLVGISSGPSRATTLRVPADFSSIAAAMSASSDGDEILVAPGTYSGPSNRNVSFGGRSVTVRSEGGPSVTTIACGDLGRAFAFDHGESGAILEGFRIERGRHPSETGGAIYVAGSSPTIRDCHFYRCSSHAGGAVYAGSGSSPRIESCTFEENFAPGGPGNGGRGGGLWVDTGASAEVVGSLFLGNEASGGSKNGPDCTGHAVGGAHGTLLTLVASRFVDNDPGIDVEQVSSAGAIIATDCLFVRGWGGIFMAFGSNSLSLSNCTFHDSRSAQIQLYSGASATIERCLFHKGTVAVSCSPYSPMDVTCCLFFSFSAPVVPCQGDVIGTNGNFVADPLLCDADAGDFSLSAASPALPQNSGGCGLIGAYGVGCDGLGVAVTPSTWGTLKALYWD